MLLHWLMLPRARVTKSLRQRVLLLLRLHLHGAALSFREGHVALVLRDCRIMALEFRHDLICVQGRPRKLLLHDVDGNDVVRLRQLLFVFFVHLLLLPLRCAELGLEVLRHVRVVVLLLLVLNGLPHLRGIELEERVRELELVQRVQAKDVLALVGVNLVTLLEPLPEKVHHAARSKPRADGNVLLVVGGLHQSRHAVGVNVIHVAHQVRVLWDVSCIAWAHGLVDCEDFWVAVSVRVHMNDDLVGVVRQLSSDTGRLGHLERRDSVGVPNKTVLDDPSQVKVWREATIAINDAQVREVLVQTLGLDQSGNVLQRVQILPIELGRLVAPQPLLVLIVCPSLKLIDVVLVCDNVQVVIQRLQPFALLGSE
mmetsp:Transcript_13268/g.37240  ORF Transcript_13268/g.37240 Transcript_13268/m.37240 type:complete len:369 (-) Transcript_13268:387-1493(-)